jgi:hypothetical protein
MPRIGVDRLEERVDLEGFRLPNQDEADDELWRIWQANDLDEESQLGHLDALVYGRSYVCVGTNDEDENTPLVTVESPHEMASMSDPKTRQVTAAAKFYKDDATQRAYGALYLPDVTIQLVRTGRGWVEDPDDGRDEHEMGRVPVVPLVNRSRTSQRYGVSEMADLISLTDAAARALTNAQIATELLAAPQRYAVGVTPDDFQDARTGETLTAWESYLGAVWALTDKDAKVGQFAAADLGNFTRIVEHYLKIGAAVSGLPMRFFGLGGDNPPSAEGIRADESSLVKRAERRERAWGGSWERVMRLVRRMVDGEWDPTLAAMETQWRDPATPTRAQQADAAVKLHAAGILPTEGAWEDMGYSATRRKKLRDQFVSQQSDPVLERAVQALAGQPTVTPSAAVDG